MFQLFFQLPLGPLLFLDHLAAAGLFCLEVTQIFQKFPDLRLGLGDHITELRKFAHPRAECIHGIFGHCGISEMSRKKSAKFRRGAVAHFVIFFIFLTEDQGDDKKDHSRRHRSSADREICGEIEISKSRRCPESCDPENGRKRGQDFSGLLAALHIQHIVFTV